jgi:hypothetical protein
MHGPFLFEMGTVVLPLKKTRCRAFTSNSARCHHYTYFHAPLCYHHMTHLAHLDIRTSTLPNAGLGLFTLIDRPRGQIIASYGGERMNIEQLASRYKKPILHPYAIELHDHSYLDTARVRSIASYINDAKTKEKTNAELYEYDNNVYIHTIKPICAGEEIFVSYGKSYWRGVQIFHSTSPMPDWEMR